MANTVTGTATSWDLPNYAGELFTASTKQTPLLSMIGGLTGGMISKNVEFPTGVTYDLPDASQPAISETASLTAPTASQVVRTQTTNVCEIHQEAIDISYLQLASMGRLSGVNTAGATNPVSDEKAFQIMNKLAKMARDIEYSFLNGKYQKATDKNTPNKTRGIIELTSTGSTVDASSKPLTTAMIKELVRKMADSGAYFSNMVLFAGSKQRQKITDLYEKQLGYNVAALRTVGGMSIKELELDFCSIGVVYDPFVPEDTIVIADVAHMAPVFMEVPKKGILFEEDLSKTGASDKTQLYTVVGLDHGPAFLHGSITKLG